MRLGQAQARCRELLTLPHGCRGHGLGCPSQAREQGASAKVEQAKLELASMCDAGTAHGIFTGNNIMLASTFNDYVSY